MESLQHRVNHSTGRFLQVLKSCGFIQHHHCHLFHYLHHFYHLRRLTSFPILLNFLVSLTVIFAARPITSDWPFIASVLSDSLHSTDFHFSRHTSCFLDFLDPLDTLVSIIGIVFIMFVSPFFWIENSQTIICKFCPEKFDDVKGILPTTEFMNLFESIYL